MQSERLAEHDVHYQKNLSQRKVSDKAKRTPGRKKQLKTKSLKISQCMIVKNEENNIRQALSWGKEIMWEQIVVDTGSADRTVQIAEELGAKVCHYVWTDDFAAAKNFAIGQAKGDWIALLDADEYMTPEDARKIQEVLIELEEREFDGLSTNLQNLNDEGEAFSFGTQVRFFRNDPDIRYRRRIHEQLETVSGRKLRIGDATQELSIFHTGYQKKAMEGKEKKGRNRRLILAELDENPNDYEMMGYMGDDCLADGESEEATTWYRRSIQHMPSMLEPDDQRSAMTFTEFLHLLTEKEALLGDGLRMDEILGTYQRAIQLLPEEADFDYILGRFFAMKNDMTRAIRHLEMALSKLDRYGCYNKAMLLSGNVFDAYEILVRCYYETGEKQKCISYAVNYLNYNRYGVEVLFWLLKALLPDEGGKEKGTMENGAAGENGEREKREVLEALSRLYDVTALKDKVILVKTAEKAVGKDFSEFLLNQLFSQEERRRLGY